MSPQAAAVDAEIMAGHWAEPAMPTGDDFAASDRAYWARLKMPAPNAADLDQHERRFMPTGVPAAVRKGHVDAVNDMRKTYRVEDGQKPVARRSTTRRRTRADPKEDAT